MTSGQFDINALFAQAEALQQQVASAADDLSRTRVEGSAGGSLVRATVTGSGELVGLHIAPEALVDAETVADLVLAAVRNAVTSAQSLQERAMGSFGGGLGTLLATPEMPEGPTIEVAPVAPCGDDDGDLDAGGHGDVIDGEVVEDDDRSVSQRADG